MYLEKNLMKKKAVYSQMFDVNTRYMRDSIILCVIVEKKIFFSEKLIFNVAFSVF